MNKRRWITLVSLAALLLGLLAALPIFGVAAEKADAEIGWIANFSKPADWGSIKLDGTTRATLADASSSVTITKNSVSEDGHSVQLFAGYSYDVNDGHVYEQYANDFYMAYSQVTVDLDKTPYLYMKYAAPNPETAFRVFVTQQEDFYNSLNAGNAFSSAAGQSGVEIEGDYRRMNLKTLSGKSGTQTFTVMLTFCYVNGAPWDIGYVFAGSDGNINGDNAVKALSEPQPPVITNQVDFADLTQWYSFEGSSPNVYTLADEDSFTKITDITADKKGATIYPKNYNGQFNMIARKVTVDVDKTPYFYTKYHIEKAVPARFQMFLHTEDHAWIVGEGKTTYNLFEGSGDTHCEQNGEYYKYDLKAAGLSGVQTFFVCLCPNYIDSYNTWTVDYMFFGTADENPYKGDEPTPVGKWSMDLSKQAADWLWLGDCKGGTYSDSIQNVLGGAESALKFTVGDDNGFGGRSLKVELNYETAGTVFYQFIGTRLTVDVDKTPYLYFKGTFSKTDFFTMYLNDQEICGVSNGVSGDKTLHEGQVLDLKAHYKSGVHSFWLIGYFYDGDGDDDKPFVIDYAYVGDENDKPVPDTDTSDESKNDPPASSDSESPDSSVSEPKDTTLTDTATGISVKNPPEAATGLNVAPITEGEDYAYVDHYASEKLKSYKAFDISLIGTDPAGTLCFPIDEALTGKEIKVYHLSDDGKLTELKIAVKDGRAETAFAQSGIYVVGTTGKAMKNPNTGVPAVSAVALFLAVSAAVCISRSKRRDH